MDDDITKNVIAIILFIVLLASMGVTLFMIIKVQTTDDKVLGDEYVIPVQVANAIITLALSYMVVSDNSSSVGYRVFITLLLIAAIAGEIYLTGYEDRNFESALTYSIITLSFLLRSFLLVKYVRGAFPQTIQTNVIAPVEKAVNQVAAPVAKMMTNTPKTESAQSDLMLKWGKLKIALKERPEGVANLKDAWEKVINPANQAGRTDVNTVLKEAVALLKDKQGNAIPLNVVGGSRARK